MQKIVIVGAGFGGLNTALLLEAKFRFQGDVSITLIDKHDYHLFTPNLYEVATAEEEFTSISQLKKSVVLSIQEAISNRRINFIKGELHLVDQKRKKITVGPKELEYDYLILALGSTQDFYNIPGAEKYALSLHSLPDALRIRNAVEFTVQSHRFGMDRRQLKFVIAGGSCSGVELAGELKGLLDRVAWKYQYPRENLEIVLLESSNRLLPEMEERAATDALLRLKELGVNVELGRVIAGVDQRMVEFLSGERSAYDVLVWATGNRAAHLKFTSPVVLDRKGRVEVDGNLRIINQHSIFALGEMAASHDHKHKFVGGLYQAFSQAEYLAEALPSIMQNRKPLAYKPQTFGYVIDIGGKWAIRHFGKKYSFGYLSYLRGQWQHFVYYRRILGFKKAWKYFWLQEGLYGRND